MAKLTEADFAEEMQQLADNSGYVIEQLKLLYRAFSRQTEVPGYFHENDFRNLLGKCGINRPEVCDRIFKAYARRMPGHGASPLLTYKMAAQALSILGVGSRANQAEGVFRCADVNRNKALSRAEMLQFLQENNPQGRFACGKQRVAAFRTVGKLFDLLGAQGREEVPMERFIADVEKYDEVYRAFQAISPYRAYFHLWDHNDFSLQNVLNAMYFAKDANEHDALVRDRVEILAGKIDADGGGTLDADEIVAAIQALYGGTRDDAEEEAKQLCGKDGMSVEEFIDAFTELAENNLEKFQAVEEAYGIK